MRQLLEREEIGDRKPSQFLRHLRSLAGSVGQDERLKPLWLSRLPNSSQYSLAPQNDVPLDKLADIVDRLNDLSPARSHVNEIQSHSNALDTRMLINHLTGSFNTKLYEILFSSRQEISAMVQ